MRSIASIILHCSASGFGDAALIRRWHVDERGWSDIGYHFVVLNGYRESRALFAGDYDPAADGLVEDGRPLARAGAHARGHNRDSIGICLIGERHFTGPQFLALDGLVSRLHGQFGALELVGHYELDAGKTCPNLNMDWVRSWCGHSGPGAADAVKRAA